MKVPNTNSTIGGTVGQPEIVSGGMAYATTPNLDAKSPIGNGVTTATYGTMPGEIISTKSADMTNSDTTLNVSASTENRSAEYKYPRNTQDTGTMYSDQK